MLLSTDNLVKIFILCTPPENLQTKFMILHLIDEIY